MKIEWKTKVDRLPETKKNLAELDGKKLVVGYSNGDDGWLGAIHEFGVNIEVTEEMRNYLHSQGLHLKKETKYIKIPERAPIRNGYEINREATAEKSEVFINMMLSGLYDADEVIYEIGNELINAIQKYAADLTDPPNHPFTASRKDGKNPLTDTGKMIKTIDYEVR